MHVTGDSRWDNRTAAEAFCRASNLPIVEYEELYSLSKVISLTGLSTKQLLGKFPALIPIDDEAHFHPVSITPYIKRRFRQLIRFEQKALQKKIQALTAQTPQEDF